MKSRIVIIGITVISMMLMMSCGNSNKKDTATQSEYPTTTVKSQSVVLEQLFPATIKGREDIEIRPRVDGFIEEIYIDEGAVVKKGQPLFRINSPESEATLITAQANVSSQEAIVKTAKLDVERIKPLAERKIISDVQLRSLENKLEVAEAELLRAQAVLKHAQSAHSWATVISPVDGVAGAIPFRRGSLVDRSAVLTIISNIDQVFVYFSMNEKELMEMLNKLPGEAQEEKIKNISNVSLRLADGTLYAEKGKMETITGSVDVTTGSANLRCVFPNPKKLLRSGTSGNIILPRTINDIFVIPQKATFSLQDKRQVYVVEQGNAVMRTISVISTSDGQSYIVTDGLSEGDVIVTDGIATLRNGMAVTVKQ